jgi:hypothetical protein
VNDRFLPQKPNSAVASGSIHDLSTSALRGRLRRSLERLGFSLVEEVSDEFDDTTGTERKPAHGFVVGEAGLVLDSEGVAQRHRLAKQVALAGLVIMAVSLVLGVGLKLPYGAAQFLALILGLCMVIASGAVYFSAQVWFSSQMVTVQYWGRTNSVKAGKAVTEDSPMDFRIEIRAGNVLTANNGGRGSSARQFRAVGPRAPDLAPIPRLLLGTLDSS